MFIPLAALVVAVLAAGASGARVRPGGNSSSAIGEARCGLAKDGCDVRCWSPGGGATFALTGQCLRRISGEMPACGLTPQGRVVCEGHPLWRAAAAERRR